MKTTIIAIFSLFVLFSCGKSEEAKPNSKGEAAEVKQVKPIKLQKKDPVPKTISIKEVARIALVEAEQFITNAKKADADVANAFKNYQTAQEHYDKGEFKKAQVLAVDVRHQVEELLNK